MKADIQRQIFTGDVMLRENMKPLLSTCMSCGICSTVLGCSKKSMSPSVYCVSFSPWSDVLDAVLFLCFPTGSSRDEKKGCFPMIAWPITPSCQQHELVIIRSDLEVQQPNPVQRPLAQKPFELHVFRPAHTNWSCVGVSASSC